MIQTRHLFPFGSFLYSKVGDIAFIQCHQLFFLLRNTGHALTVDIFVKFDLCLGRRCPVSESTGRLDCSTSPWRMICAGFVQGCSGRGLFPGCSMEQTSNNPQCCGLHQGMGLLLSLGWSRKALGHGGRGLVEALAVLGNSWTPRPSGSFPR